MDDQQKPQPEKLPKGNFQQTKLRAILIILGLALVISGAFIYFGGGKQEPAVQEPAISGQPSPSPAPAQAVGESQKPGDEQLLFPLNKLFITAGRYNYDGEMRLVIPKLELDTKILSGVEDKTLKKGPGLYDYAQMPDTGNSNVSIAGHRDIYGSHFYYIDTLTAGDLLYLVYQGSVYKYAYRYTEIISPDDWGPIYSKRFSALTLTSCDPIGTSKNRIIVTAELVEVSPDAPDFSFQTADTAYSGISVGKSGQAAETVGAS